jgi:hypothetical protein
MGSVDGAVTLSQPLWALETDAAGNLYVAQGRVPWIEVYDASGAPLRRIGSGGEGPGEFAFGANALGWKSDTLWAVEPLSGTHLFGPSGREAMEIAFQAPVASEISRIRPGPLLADGSLLGAPSLRGELFRRMRFPILRFTRDGEILDTIAEVGWSSEPYLNHETESASGGRQPRATRHPLQDFAIFSGTGSLPFDLSRDGASVVFVEVAEPSERRRFSPLRFFDRIAGSRGSFTLLRIGIDGDTLLARSIPYERKPVTAGDADWLRDEFAAIIAMDYAPRSGSMAPPFVPDEALRARWRADAREDLTLPEFFPPVRSILSGADGMIWLLREFRPDRADLWEIYDGAGRLTGSVLVSEGRVTTPMSYWPHMQILRATRDEVWGLTVDDLDVPILHRFRVVPGC